MINKDRVLVVEDSTIVNRHICSILESEGFECTSAYKAKQCMEIISKDSNYELVLMDMMMETNDAGLIAGRKLNETYNVPIVFLTALSDQKTVKEAMGSLPFGYLTKPFDENILVSTIKVAIKRSKIKKELMRNVELFHNIIDSVDQSLVLIAEEKIIYANKVFEQLTSQSLTKLTNKKLEDVVNFHICSKSNPEKILRKDVDNVSDKDVFRLAVAGETIEPYFGDFYLKKTLVDGREVTLITFKDVTDRIMRQRMVQESQSQYVNYIIEGQTIERNRVAREMHDGLGQLLNLLKLKIKSGDSPDPEILGLLDQTMEEAVRISEDMMPRMVVDFPIETSIAQMLKGYETEELSIHFSHSKLPSIMDQVIKFNLFRIVQEAINNSMKYSDSKNIFIQMNYVDENLLLMVEDDGKGFDLDVLEGNGLSNMKQRATSIGGNLWLESEVGKGTIVICDLPISKNMKKDVKHEDG